MKDMSESLSLELALIWCAGKKRVVKSDWSPMPGRITQNKDQNVKKRDLSWVHDELSFKIFTL